MSRMWRRIMVGIVFRYFLYIKKFLLSQIFNRFQYMEEETMKIKPIIWKCPNGHRMKITAKQIKEARIRQCYCSRKPSSEEWNNICLEFALRYCF